MYTWKWQYLALSWEILIVVKLIVAENQISLGDPKEAQLSSL